MYGEAGIITLARIKLRARELAIDESMIKFKGRLGFIQYNPKKPIKGKRARSLFNCISVTDGIKINEQNKSIGIGPLYLHTEFEAISYSYRKLWRV